MFRSFFLALLCFAWSVGRRGAVVFLLSCCLVVCFLFAFVSFCGIRLSFAWIYARALPFHSFARCLFVPFICVLCVGGCATSNCPCPHRLAFHTLNLKWYSHTHTHPDKEQKKLNERMEWDEVEGQPQTVDTNSFVLCILFLFSAWRFTSHFFSCLSAMLCVCLCVLCL